MSAFFTESDYENAIMELFENMGYTHIHAPDMGRMDFSDPLLDSVLRDSLVKINKGLPYDAITEAIGKLRNFDSGSLVQKNVAFMNYLQNGVPVKYYDKGEERSVLVYLIDYKKPQNNAFYVVNQYTYIENGNNRRPDVILYINGLPLVLMELKSPSKDEVGAENAYNQIRNYMQDIPSMFIYNAICVISDLYTNKAGTITSGLGRFMAWKTKDGDYENTDVVQFDTFFEGMFQKERLLDILKNFILFSGDSQKPIKILAGYEAKSATTDRRPNFQRMIEDSGRNLFDIVLVHKLDRFSRNRYDSAIYKSKLKKNHVSIASVLERIDDSPESVMMEAMLEGMAEYYSKNLSREVKKGMNETALQCKHTGGCCPLGFDLDSEKRLVINDHEAEAVRAIFEMYANGYGYSAIIDYLNAHGYHPKRGGMFKKNSLHDILGNEKYIGTFVYNRATGKDGSFHSGTGNPY